MNSIQSELSCPACRHVRICDRAAIARRLQSVKMLKADSDADDAILLELLKAAAGRLTCDKCGATGLQVAVSPELADDEWQQARSCQQCNKPIPQERLEVFPDTVLCVACQAGDERGVSPDAAQYCERCGQVMQMRQTRGGITRYAMICPNCRR